jgi:hypothetical protein
MTAPVLPPEVTSPQQLERLIGQLEQRQATADQAAIKAQVAAGHQAGTPLAAASAEGIATDELLANLKRILEEAPQLHVTLAAMPSAGLKRDLVAALRTAVDPQVLVTFSFSSALGGGMVVRCGSRIFDWSYRKRLLDHAAAFTGVLRRV